MHVQPRESDNNPAVENREFEMLQSAGATSIRFDLIWPTLEWNRKGQHDPRVLRALDATFRRAAAHHLEVIVDLWSTPCWASTAPTDIVGGCKWGWWERPVSLYPPANPEDYADIAAFIAKRWSRYMAALELWNEPQGSQFFLSLNPASDYARLVRAVYPKVKAVEPTLPVIMSLGGTDTTFLSLLYGYGVKGYYDGIAVHPYGELKLEGLRAFHSFQLSQGDQTSLWVTEVGWASTVFGEQTQADDIASVLRQAATLDYVAAAEIYDMRDGGTDPANPEDHFGLVDYKLKPKPAWDAFQHTLLDLAPGPPPQPATYSPSSRSAGGARVRYCRRAAGRTCRRRRRKIRRSHPPRF